MTFIIVGGVLSNGPPEGGTWLAQLYIKSTVIVNNKKNLFVKLILYLFCFDTNHTNWQNDETAE